MTKRARVTRALLFFVIAGSTGFGASLLAGHVARRNETISMDLSSLVNFRNQLHISNAILDGDEDGITDSAVVTIAGVPGFEFSYLLYDRDQNGSIEGVIAHVGTEPTSSEETLNIFDTDADDKIDHVSFRLRNHADPSTGISYVYRDLDVNGRIDMITLSKNGRPGYGYILRGTELHRYEKHTRSDWCEVELLNPEGELVSARFQDGEWTIVPKELTVQ